MKIWKILAVTLSVLLFGGIMVIFGGLDRIFIRDIYDRVTLREKFTFTEDWQEIDFGNDNMPKKDIQMISINVEPPTRFDPVTPGFVLVDGKVAKPEMYLVDVEGNRFDLSWVRSVGESNGSYGNEELENLKVPFKKLFVRSDVPFNSSLVQWTEYNIKDMK